MQRCTFKTGCTFLCFQHIILQKEAHPKKLSLDELYWKCLNPDDNLFRVQWSATRKPKDQLREVSKFFKQLSKVFDDDSAKPRKKRQPLGPDSFPKFIHGVRSQISTVWSNYGNSRRLHLKFLNEYMPQKNKKEVSQKPVLFGNISEEEYRKKAAGRHYKWMLSPETVMDADALKIYTREWIRRYEQFNKVNVDWQAVVHTNTEHPHVHIVINGLTKDRKPFKQSPDFIRVVGRQISNEILTWMNGERTKEQVQAQKERMPYANRWTKLDEQIKQLLSENSNEKNTSNQIEFETLSLELRNRLEHLKDLGIAEYHDGIMTLETDWDKTLRSLGRYNTYLDARSYVSVGSKISMYKPETGTVRGVVRKVYVMDDENVWKNALVVEDTASKKAYFVPLYTPDRKSKPGDKVTISAERGQKGRLRVSVVNSGRMNRTSSMQRNSNDMGMQF